MRPNYIIAPPNPGKIIGRVDLLARIHEELQSGQPVALVHGMGGIGKTTAAAAYAHHPDYCVDYDAICWLEVITELSRTFTSAVPLQRFLGVDELVSQTLLTPQSDPETPREVYAFMHVVEALQRCPQRLLLLLDNANEEQELRRCLPALLQSPNVRLLVTSRAECDDFNPIPVEALPPEEAAALFLQHYAPEATGGTTQSHATSEVYDLIASFDHHTLLVEMLGKIGREAGYSLPELLRHVRELTLREEKWQIPVGTGQSGRTHRMTKQTLKTYLAHLFREIKNLSEDDTGLLRRLCVLPNRGYRTEELAQLLGREGDAVFALRKQLAALDQRGIPLLDAEQRGQWRLHPLFREVCLDQLGPFTTENLEPLVDVVGEMVVIHTRTQNWQTQFENRVFAEEILKYLEEDDGEWESYLLNELSLCYKAFGRYEEVRVLREKALASALKYWGPEHPKLAVFQSNLANVYSDLGQYEKARDLGELALASTEKNFGPEHPTMAVRQSNLATVYSGLGQNGKALGLLELALASDLKNFGPEHPTVAVRQSNLTSVYRNLGQYKKARDLGELALASTEKNFGSEHPSVAVCRNNLAHVYFEEKNYPAAIEQFRKTLAIIEKTLGREHPYYKFTTESLAAAQQEAEGET